MPLNPAKVATILWTVFFTFLYILYFVVFYICHSSMSRWNTSQRKKAPKKTTAGGGTKSGGLSTQEVTANEEGGVGRIDDIYDQEYEFTGN